jgi:hypothetical protein
MSSPAHAWLEAQLVQKRSRGTSNSQPPLSISTLATELGRTPFEIPPDTMVRSFPRPTLTLPSRVTESHFAPLLVTPLTTVEGPPVVFVPVVLSSTVVLSPAAEDDPAVLLEGCVSFELMPGETPVAGETVAVGETCPLVSSSDDEPSPAHATVKTNGNPRNPRAVKIMCANPFVQYVATLASLHSWTRQALNGNAVTKLRRSGVK